MAQVLFFTEFEFTKRDYERFGIQLMRESGIQVFVFDLSLVYFPSLRNKNGHHFEGYFEVKSYPHFEELFEHHVKDGYCIIMMPQTVKLWPYFKKIWTSPLKIMTLRLGGLPSSVQASGNRVHKILNNLLKPKEIVLAAEIFLLSRLSKVFNLEKKSNVFVCAGKKVESSFSSSGTVISCGSLDFNTFLKTPPTGEKRHITFLDEFQPFHPDFDRLGVKKISPEKYFDDLNRFFETLEIRYQVPVVIAAHPAASIDDYSKHFLGRKVIRGETATLVRDSLGVVGHTSTAFQYAFLYGKPTCFIVTEEMTHGFYRSILKSYLDFGFCFYNVSMDEDLEKAQFFLDEPLARRYINDFVISEGTPRVNTWEHLIEYIKGDERK